jgi:hypothetical protein
MFETGTVGCCPEADEAERKAAKVSNVRFEVISVLHSSMIQASAKAPKRNKFRISE